MSTTLAIENTLNLEKTKYEFVEWFFSLVEISKESILENHFMQICDACDHPFVISTLHKYCKFTKEDIIIYKQDVLRKTCKNGNIIFLKWFDSIVNISRDDIIHNCAYDEANLNETFVEDYQLLRSACLYGQIKIVKWFHEKVTFTKDEIIKSQCHIPRRFYNSKYSEDVDYLYSYESAYPEILKWLHKECECEFTRSDFDEWHVPLYLQACRTNDFQFVEFLHSICNYTRNELMAYDNFAFKCAIKKKT